VKNVARSVAQKLLNASRKTGEEHMLLLMRYGAERLLYRIGQSRFADQFILKGATLFLV
jgi:predicted nucleotidyltransferase component of viral defense system